ncbi:MAG: c-type cytochrome [Polyangiaceae bacterium]
MRLRQVLSFGSAAIACATALFGCRAEPEIGREETAVHQSERFQRGASAWSRYCALCHKPDATGYGADHAPSLVSSTFLESATDDFLAKGIREGRPNTAMAAYGKSRGGPLEEEDIFAIVDFLRDKGSARLRMSKAPVEGDAARGEAIYVSTCQECHGTKTTRATAVHLANPVFLSHASDAFLRHAVVHGRPNTPMPAFAGVLSEDKIDDVVAYLRSFARPVENARRAPQEPPPLGQPVINPHGPNPEFKLRDDKYVAIADVKKAIDEKKKIVVIDARAVSDWYLMHIPGSISVPYYSFDRLDQLPKDGTWITAYCACPHHASGVVVDELRKRGFPHTAVLDEGILEWKRREYPTETTPLPDDMGAALPLPTAPIPPTPVRDDRAPRRPIILPIGPK